MWLIVAIEIGVPLFLMGMVAFVPQPNKVLFSLFAVAIINPRGVERLLG